MHRLFDAKETQIYNSGHDRGLFTLQHQVYCRNTTMETIIVTNANKL